MFYIILLHTDISISPTLYSQHAYMQCIMISIAYGQQQYTLQLTQDNVEAREDNAQSQKSAQSEKFS